MLKNLQFVQNAEARISTRTEKYEHITPVLTSLHWLPTKYRTELKVLLLTFKALHGLAPVYQTNPISPQGPSVLKMQGIW